MEGPDSFLTVVTAILALRSISNKRTGGYQNSFLILDFHCDPAGELVTD